jgi:8-oxo-dGTP diphosphatase
MRVPRAVWVLVKEVARHVFKRPLIGVAAAARTEDGRWLLIRRGDSGGWALPGGTLDWGETLRDAVKRELAEEAGVEVLELGGLSGVYSAPHRDFRVHGVTIVIHALVTEPSRAPENPIEISEVRLFTDQELPAELSHHMTDMLENARRGTITWE